VAQPDWRIVSWRTREFTCTDREHLLYEDVLDRVITDRADLDRARTSIHEQFAVRSVLDKDFVAPHPYFSRIAFDRHPAVAVVDIDRDGFDDIYIMERMGKNMLFRNTGDGRFDEIATAKRRVVRGSSLYHGGDRFDSLYAVRSGFLKTTVLNDDGREQVTGFNMSGELLGLDGIGGGVHEGNAVALEDCEVLEVSTPDLDDVVRLEDRYGRAERSSDGR